VLNFHLPAWAYKTLAAIGGFGFIFQQAIKPMLLYVKDVLCKRHDQPVWEVIKQPKPKLAGWQGDKPFYEANAEAPYSTKELSEKVGRSNHSVLNSLSRLEKRGKVKELHGGWQRKEK
jgi:predicted Rossmann fold nucleotide-binding protein DprA/Smf involved in DNA uptake